MTEQGPAEDRAAEQLTRMLTELANDPDAPASTVTARSVLDAARAAAVGAPDAAPGAGVAGMDAVDDRPPASVGDLHVQAVKAEAARAKSARRRTTVFSLAAAAAVAAVAAVVIPFAISGNSGTTSANSARDAGPAAAAPQSVAGSAAAGATAGDSGQQSEAAQESAAAAAGGGADAAAPQLDTGADAGRPPPGENAVTSVVPTGVPANPQPTGTVPDSCWPALPESAAAALTAALPAGSFAAPEPLAAGCGPEPVAGAALSGTATPGTALEVRVSKADPGRCARGDSEAGVRCVPRGDGVYVVTDAGGSPTAYVYANGNEVAVGPPSADGLTPTGSGLTADQTVAAAQAVLTALG